MKILHIIDSGGLYGAEMVLLNLMVEQEKLGLQPVLASIGEIGIERKAVEEEGLKRGLGVVKFRMRPGPNLSGARKILGFARRESFDLLHSHGYKANVLFGFMPKFIRGLPLVTTLHGWTGSGLLNKLQLYEWLDKQSLQFMDAVVLVSQSMMLDPALLHCKPGRVHVVPNGIPTDQFQLPAQGSRSSHPGDAHGLDSVIVGHSRRGFTIGAVGRLSPEKGFLNLIKAVNLIRQQEVEVGLIIIGEGPERALLERETAGLGLQSTVLLPGYRSNAATYMPLFDAFVLSSFTEGLPITLLEAMAVGVPSVATPVGGMPDILEHGKAGIITESTSPEALAAGIMKVLRDPEKGKRLAQRANVVVRDFYSIRKTAREYLSIYSSLV